MIDLEKEINAFSDKYRTKENKIVFDHKRLTWFFEDISFNDQDEKTLINLRIIWLGWLDCAKSKQSEINELNAKLEAAQVPEGFVLVPKEFNEKLAEKMAAEMVNKPIPENDPVWIEIANKAYKDNLLMKKWEIIRNCIS